MTAKIPSSLFDTSKMLLGGRFIALNVYLRKKKDWKNKVGILKKLE